MKKLLLLAVSLLLLVGCKSTKEFTHTEKKDSTRLEVREVYIEKIDTVLVEIPKEVVKAIADTSSYLETKYALSSARIDTYGKLYHTLESKPQNMEVYTKTIQIVRDTVLVKDKSEVVKERVEVEVEKPLSKFQHFQITAFWVLAAVALLLILLFGRSFFTKLKHKLNK